MLKIKKKKEFDFVFKKGRSAKNEFLVLKYVKNGLKENRVAFIISSKVSKSAVKRNKARRRLYDILRKINQGDYKKGFDLIFIALPGLEKADFKEIEAMVKKTLSKVY